MNAIGAISRSSSASITFGAQLNTATLRKYSAPFSMNERPSVNVSIGFGANTISADSSGDVFALNGSSVKINRPTGTLLGTLACAFDSVATCGYDYDVKTALIELLPDIVIN